MKHLFVLSILLIPTLKVQAEPIYIEGGPLESGKIFLNCQINQTRDKCFFDSGKRGITVLNTPDFASMKKHGEIRESSASGAVIACDRVTPKSIRVASSVSFDQQSIARCPFSEKLPKISVGIDPFKDSVVRFDFQVKKLSFANKSLKGVKQASEWRTEPKGHIALPVTIDQLDVYGIWDTGAGLTSVDTAYVTKHPDKFTFVQELTTGIDATGNPVKMKLYKLKALSILGTKFADISVLAFDFKPIRPYFNRDVQLILGFNLLSKKNWVLDFPNRMILPEAF
ncbi:MAG: hypothetical protein HRU19_24790 [Pseudobacteriovorax sp.]|nr:hypothetical protein [Pseudobacteriovorax sp.]